MISVFCHNSAGDAININSMLYDMNNIVTYENFDDFIASKNDSKIFLVDERIFINTQLSYKNLLNDLRFIDNYIETLIINDIDIVFDISTGGISESYFRDFFKFVEQHKINPEKLTILVNTQTEYYILCDLIKEFQKNINVVFTGRNEILFFEDLFFYKRPKRFLFLCRRWTIERMFIFIDLHMRNILENSFYSFTFNRDPYRNDVIFSGTDADTNFQTFIKLNGKLLGEHGKKLIEYWHENKKDIIDNEPYWFGNNIQVQHDAEVIDKFNKSYMSLCVETKFNSTVHFQPSEKIYKCCYYNHPFVVYSTPKFLDAWNKSGYKSYSDIIDESYDNETNNLQRILLINEQVEKLNKMDIKDFVNKIKKSQQTVSHNHGKLVDKFQSPKSKNLYTNKNKTIDDFLRNEFRLHMEP